MATINDLKPSLSELEHPHALRLILNIRQSRMDYKKPLAVEKRVARRAPKVKKQIKTADKLIANLSPEQLQELINKLQKDT